MYNSSNLIICDLIYLCKYRGLCECAYLDNRPGCSASGLTVAMRCNVAMRSSKFQGFLDLRGLATATYGDALGFSPAVLACGPRGTRHARGCGALVRCGAQPNRFFLSLEGCVVQWVVRCASRCMCCAKGDASVPWEHGGVTYSIVHQDMGPSACLTQRRH